MQIYIGRRYAECVGERHVFEVHFGAPLDQQSHDEELVAWIDSECSGTSVELVEVTDTGAFLAEVYGPESRVRVRDIFRICAAALMECEPLEIDVIYGTPDEHQQATERLKGLGKRAGTTVLPPTSSMRAVITSSRPTFTPNSEPSHGPGSEQQRQTI